MMKSQADAWSRPSTLTAGITMPTVVTVDSVYHSWNPCFNRWIVSQHGWIRSPD